MLLSVGHPKQSWKSGYTSGFGFFSTSMYWLWYNPFPQGAILGWFAMSLYCGLYLAAWVGISFHVWKYLIGSRMAEEKISKRFIPLIFQSSEKWPSFWKRLGWCIFAASLWVVLEWFRSRVITGLPWNLLGMTQANVVGLATFAKWSGMSLVSFIVCFSSLNIGMAMISIIKSPGKPLIGVRELSPLLILFLGVVLNHFSQVRHELGLSQNSDFSRLLIGCVQPGFSQHDIWTSDDKKREEMWEHVLDLTEKAVEHEPRPDLILWPEGAVSGMTMKRLRIVSQIAKNHGIAFIISMTTATRDPENPREFLEFNSAVFIDENGNWMNQDNDWLFVYHKQHLVPFGEFIPLVSIFPWLSDLLPIGEFERGTEPGLLHWKTKDIHLGINICFEDAMAPLIRRSTSNETQILVNLTNDAWFGRSSAQWQHVRAAQFRAIEMGIPIVKAANNGISCWATQNGFLHNVRFDNLPEKSVYSAGYKAFTVKIGIPGQTLYKSLGDWWSILSIGGCTFCLLAIETSKRFPFKRLHKSN